MVKQQFQLPIKNLQTDNDGEYTTTSLHNFVLQNGIQHRYSCPHTPEQNDLAERKNRHILEVSRALHIAATLPANLWMHSILTAAYLINLLPSSVTFNSSPYELLFQKPPTYLHLKTFGCLCFPWLKPYSTTKLSPRSLPCVFLGYASSHKGYLCLNTTTGHTYTSRHVKFFENIFPFASTNLTSTTPTSPLHSSSHNSTLSLYPRLLQPYPSNPPHNSPSNPPLFSPPTTTSPTSQIIPHTSLPNPPTQPTDIPIPSPPPPPVHPPSHHMITRHKSGHLKPRSIFNLSSITSVTPTSYSTAILHPEWRAAMSQEFNALLSQGTWEVTPLPLPKTYSVLSGPIA